MTATDQASGRHGAPSSPDDPASRVPATLLLVGGMAAFGSATPVAKIVGEGFPVWVGAALRMALAAAVLVPLVALGRRSGDDRPLLAALRETDAADRWRLTGIALVGTFGFTVLMLLGMRNAPGAVAAVVMATTPAVTAIGAVIFLGDHLGWTRIFAVGLAVAGVVVVNLGSDVQDGSGSNVVLGSALVFGAVLCEATYSLLGKRLTASLTAAQITTVAAVGALIAFLPLALWDLREAGAIDPEGGQWAAAIWWGVGTMALGSLLWFAGMARVAAGYAAAFMAVMPLSALLLSYVLLGESFQWAHLIGIGLVLIGLAAVVRSGATVH